MSIKQTKQSILTYLLLSLVCLALLGFSSCSLASDSTTGTLVINFPSTTAKSVFSPSISLDITSYLITLTNGTEIEEFRIASTDSLTIDSLIPGEWTIEVQGYNGTWSGTVNSGDMIAYLELNSSSEHSVTASVNRGAVTDVDLTLVPISDGYGTLVLSVDWSEVSSDLLLNDPTIAIQVEGYNEYSDNYEDNSGSYDPTSTVDSTYTYSLAPGWYEITTTLTPSSDSDGETSDIYTSIDFARIVPDETTSGYIELTDTMLSTGSVTWELSQDMDDVLDSFTVSFTGLDDTKYTGVDQNFTCSYESDNPTYQWYVDAEAVDAATSKDFTYQFTTSGSHVVTVAVADGGVVNGASLSVAVEQGYTVGNHGPAGGWIYYCDESDSYEGWTYLEVSPAELPDTHVWSNVTTTTLGTTLLTLGSGLANTEEIINQEGHTTSAAQACVDYSVTIGGNVFNDWFLPALWEATSSYREYLIKSTTTYKYWWTSSEANGYTTAVPFYLVASSSSSYISGQASSSKTKSVAMYVRPIRRF